MLCPYVIATPAQKARLDPARFGRRGTNRLLDLDRQRRRDRRVFLFVASPRVALPHVHVGELQLARLCPHGARQFCERLTRHLAERKAMRPRKSPVPLRELLLAQSSDWAFIMKTNTTVEYAKKRTRDHIARFDYLYRALTGQAMLEEPILAEFENRDNIFPDIDYRVYR